MAKEYRINVYEDDESRCCSGSVVARVRYNSNLDFWDGRNWGSGSVGMHKGITKLRDGRYVIIIGSQWQGSVDYGYIVSPQEALQEILRSGNTELLDMKKFRDLKALYNSTMTKEGDEEEA